MSTPPPREIDVTTEKKAPECRVTISLDSHSLLPIRPDGITDEQFKQGCPDEKSERYLKYLRGIKNRISSEHKIIPASKFKQPELINEHHADAKTVERHAEGYPQLAAVINSDERFMLYRRFGFLQTRLLLNKQEEMRVLERRLYHIDRYYGRNEPARLRSHDICNAIDDDHRNIVVECEKKYNEYAQLLTHARTLASFDKPRAADYLRLKDYFDRFPPLCGDEQEWILLQDDLITLKPTRDNTWLDTLIERIPERFPCRLTRSHNYEIDAKYKQTEANYPFNQELRQKTNPDTTKIFLSDPDRVNAIASVVLLATVLGSFVIPVTILWCLFQMSNPGSANIGIILAILLASAFIFSAVISLFTRAKRHEVLAATAAYCAGLVLFVGNVETVGEMFLAD
ncbi:hypothetical protein BTUL_0146g00170 [Botrytis tulipae]|uniref:DUF6594 domain-containing protein n=1 Tax=Botrytis tulipae TaxID=87230 RepID=A0A4Z1EFL6_9HELO|nr:hypothetical protein BTUL_0146g00170 [Botrytis tulipae]